MSHRYWRIKVNDSWGDISGWGVELKEIEFRGIRGGTDLTGSGTAFSDAGTAANAFDNNTSTGWDVNNTWPHYIGYDFGDGNDVDLAQFTLTADNSSQFKSKFPNDFELQYSDDDVVYTTTQTWINAEPDGQLSVLSFNVDIDPLTDGMLGEHARSLLNKLIDLANTNVHGFVDYNDTDTAVTPITPVVDTWTKLTNNGAGAQTEKAFLPDGVTDIWDEVADDFDFSQLSNGDMIVVRVAIEVTTPSPNTAIHLRLALGIGGTTFELDLGGEHAFKAAGLHPITEEVHLSISNDNVRLNSGEVQVISDTASTDVEVIGWNILVWRNGFT